MMDETNYQVNLLTAMNTKLLKDENMLRLICDKSDNAFIYYSYAEKKDFIFGNWSHFFDFPKEDFRFISQIMDCVEEEFIVEVFECLSLEKQGVEKGSVDFKLKGKNIWVELQTNVVYENEIPSEKIFCLKDITKFKLQNDELSYLAYYDFLTGLLNRNYFVTKLNELIEKAKENSAVVSVLFIDIDDFRKINDGMGIIVGDEVVQIFGQYLKDFICDDVIVSHFNSDIFCIAVYDPCGVKSIEHILNEIKLRLNEPMKLSTSAEFNLTVSIGIAEYPEASRTALELINCAEIVMFKAKHKGKNLVQYFDAPIIQEFIDNVKIERKLEKALKNQNFFMYYQPQYDTNTGKLRGIEALIRWRDEEGNLISPNTFIPLAEKNGTILPLGDWIIEESISDYAKWHEKYQLKTIILSINISALQFKNKNFVNNLVHIIEKYEVPPQLIELEITESVFIDDMQDIINKMNILREIGIRFSMDDFGTGFSSLAYLRRLPIDTLKIDKSLIDTVVTDEPSRTIAESIIELGKKLGFDTIAEGVEEEVQYRLLKNIGCENIQGFYFGKPMDFNAIDELLKAEDV